MDRVWSAAAVVLGACSVVAYAYPSEPPGIVPSGIVPIIPSSITKHPLVNTTVPPTPTETDSSCSASCTVELPAWSALSWVRATDLVYTSTITVATKIYSIDKVNNFTVTRTQYTPLPEGLTFQSLATNNAGTVYASHFLTGNDGFRTFTQLAYPTPYVDYATEYNWQGVLPTADKTGNTFCDTATALNTAVLPSYTAYPQPPAGRPDPADRIGLGYTLLWVTQSKEFDISFLSSSFPAVSAFAFCTPTPFPVPPALSPITTVKLLTATETTYTNFPSAPIQHTESSASGFESSTKSIKPSTSPSTHTSSGDQPTAPAAVRTEKSVSGFEDYTTTLKPNLQNPGNPNGPGYQPPSTKTVRIEQSASGFNPPSATGGGGGGGGGSQPTARPNNERPVSGQDAVQNGRTTAPAAAEAVSGISTIAVLTTVSGTPTAVIGFVLPNGKTGMVGQTVTVEGKTTVLGGWGSGPAAVAQTAVPTVLETTVDNVRTSMTAWMLPGGSTASVGQTVTIAGSKTVLGTPSPTKKGDAAPSGNAEEGDNNDRSTAWRLGVESRWAWALWWMMVIMRAYV